MKTVICEKCGTEIKQRDALANFLHCNKRQRCETHLKPIIPVNKNNISPSINKDTGIKEEKIKEVINTQNNNSLSNDLSSTSEAGLNPYPALEVEEEEIIEEEKPIAEKEYKYQCPKCSAMFDEHNGFCPNENCNLEFK
jgi:hypothetical protein